MRAKKVLERKDGSTEIIGNKIEDVAVNEGDLLHFITWGGGGWGDPLERDPELVGLEIRQGLVTNCPFLTKITNIALLYFQTINVGIFGPDMASTLLPDC